MKLCVLSVLLATWTHSVSGLDIELYPPYPQVNQTVILNIQNINGAIQYSEWYRGTGTNASNQILSVLSDGRIINGRQFFKEANGFRNGSLAIKDVQKSHEGDYTVSVLTNQLQQATVRLTLYEPTGGLSNGAIVGIFFGVLVFVAIVIAIAVYIFKTSGKAAHDQPGVI